jgi:hypothetical protein
MAVALRTLDREYTNLTLQMGQSNESWTALAGVEELAELQAREYFWQKTQERVLEEVNRLQNEGWEPVEPIGPESIKLRKSQSIDFSILPSDVLLWFMTLGIALIMQLIMNTPRRYVTYRPVQVRIRMSRLKRYPLTTAA